jgi:hypothetical protein
MVDVAVTNVHRAFQTVHFLASLIYAGIVLHVRFFRMQLVGRNGSKVGCRLSDWQDPSSLLSQVVFDFAYPFKDNAWLLITFIDEAFLFETSILYSASKHGTICLNME